MRIVKKKLRHLEFIQEGELHIAEFILPNFIEGIGSFGVPGRVEVRAKEVAGIKADPNITLVEYQGEKIPVRIGPYYMRGIKKIPFWRRLVVRWRCARGLD